MQLPGWKERRIDFSEDVLTALTLNRAILLFCQPSVHSQSFALSTVLMHFPRIFFLHHFSVAFHLWPYSLALSKPQQGLLANQDNDGHSESCSTGSWQADRHQEGPVAGRELGLPDLSNLSIPLTLVNKERLVLILRGLDLWQDLLLPPFLI